MNRLPAQLPALTSIRGLAALGVLLFHLRDTYPGQVPWLEWFARGSMGVDLFFVLSGFILAHVYLRFAGHVPSARAWREFIVARLARIYPLHLATLLAMLGLVLAWPAFAQRYQAYTSAFAFVLNLLLVHNWGLIRVSWNIPSWSISAEWFMYLVFPLLAMPRFWIAASARALLALMAAIAAAQLALVFAAGWNDYGGMSLGGMTRVVFGFTLGFAARHFWGRVAPTGPSRGIGVAQFVFAAGLLACIVFKPIWYGFVPCAAALVCTLACGQGTLALALAARPLVYLGEISYSLYMWHFLIIQVANTADLQQRLGGGPQAAGSSAALLAAIALAAAVLSYRFIEQPCRRAVSALGRGARPRGLQAS